MTNETLKIVDGAILKAGWRTLEYMKVFNVVVQMNINAKEMERMTSKALKLALYQGLKSSEILERIKGDGKDEEYKDGKI